MRTARYRLCVKQIVLIQSTRRGEDAVGVAIPTQGVALSYINIAPLGQNAQTSPKMLDEPIKKPRSDHL